MWWTLLGNQSPSDACLTGDRYDGKWEEGEQSGVGVFTWADGSSYNGFWRNGRKHGVGVRVQLPAILLPRADQRLHCAPAIRQPVCEPTYEHCVCSLPADLKHGSHII